MPVIRLADGATVILCTRGRKTRPTCYVCGHPAPFLCDGPGAKGKTCDRPMCDEHRERVGAESAGTDRDLCGTHVAWEAKQAGR